MKKTPNPVIKLLFQVCFSPHERAALAILLIKTHITMSRLSPRPRSPELGSAGSPGHKTGGKRQMGTVTLYSTPGIPDSGYTHCHSPITSPQQEKWHRSHKVMLDRYRCSAQQTLCRWRCTLQSSQTGHLCPQCSYRAQHTPHLGNLFSLEFSPPSTAIIESQNHRIV